MQLLGGVVRLWRRYERTMAPKAPPAIGNTDADRRWHKVCNVLYGKDRLKHGGRSHPMIK